MTKRTVAEWREREGMDGIVNCRDNEIEKGKHREGFVAEILNCASAAMLSSFRLLEEV